MQRRHVLLSGGAIGAGAIAAVLGGLEADAATDAVFGPQTRGPYPAGLSRTELQHLKTFDELDFVVFSNEQWDRLPESHARHIRVHMPDGSTTEGLAAHVESLKYLFTFAPDTRIKQHPIRIAMNELTAVTGVMRGTFTQPLRLPDGTVVPPNGQRYALSMCTVGVWNAKGTMDEEWLFWDNQSFFGQLGLG